MDQRRQTGTLEKPSNEIHPSQQTDSIAPARGRIIDSIELPSGLRALEPTELEVVCRELRDELIDVVSKAGGHFASSLGATEITVALHHVFETPRDKLVWDTGHQGYVHKMVTGRRHALPTIRQRGGLCGFLSRDESEFDVFGAGHAGTSISAALGVLEGAQRRAPETKVVAIIGDGALTSGMALEALNHAGALKRNLIVVLNDNEMSISKNVGALSWLFSHAVTSKFPTAVRAQFKKLHTQGYVPDIVYKAIDRAEDAAQGFFATASLLFEAFGFRYIGPVDGHNIHDLVRALRNAREQDGPVLIHAHTLKGKGYEPAENDPILWHGVTPFRREEGTFLSAITPTTPTRKIPSYTTVFAETLTGLAKADPSIVGITAAMPGGTGLDLFQREVPEQFYDVGICEQHAVTFAAGLATEGMKPVCAIYSTFLQRGFDQVLHDVGIQRLPVVFALDRSGVVGNDGHTHQGLYDISFLRAIPGMTIMSGKDENELRHLLYTALHHNGPSALRYPRGNGIGVDITEPLRTIPIGSAEILRSGGDILILGFGPIVNNGLAAAEALASAHGVEATVVNARFAKPLDTELLDSLVPRFDVVITLEDHTVVGGFGSAVTQHLHASLQAPLPRVIIKGFPDTFIDHASQAEQYAAHRLDVKSLTEDIASLVAEQRTRRALVA